MLAQPIVVTRCAEMLVGEIGPAVGACTSHSPPLVPAMIPCRSEMSQKMGLTSGASKMAEMPELASTLPYWSVGAKLTTPPITPFDTLLSIRFGVAPASHRRPS